jgi:nucleoside-diphosphate-sugar epimerase
VTHHLNLTQPTNQIDVRDLALLHLQSVTNPAASNKRFLIGQALSFQQIADILKEGMPELKGRLAKDGDGEPDLVFPRMETESVEATFEGWRYRAKEETFVEQARRLLELEGKLGK